MPPTCTSHVLPTELFERIVVFLSNRRDLLAVASSCWFLHCVAIPKLYGSIVFSEFTDFKTVELLLSTISTSPTLAAQIHTLVLDWSHTSISNLETLPATVFALKQGVSLPNVRELHIIGARTPDRYQLDVAPIECATFPLDIIYRACQPEQLVRLTFSQCPLIGQIPEPTPTFLKITWLCVSNIQTLSCILRGGGGEVLRTLIYSPIPSRQGLELVNWIIMVQDIVDFFTAACTLPALREVMVGCTLPVGSSWLPQPMPHVTRFGFHFSCVLKSESFKDYGRRLTAMFPNLQTLELRCKQHAWGVSILPVDAGSRNPNSFVSVPRVHSRASNDGVISEPFADQGYRSAEFGQSQLPSVAEPTETSAKIADLRCPTCIHHASAKGIVFLKNCVQKTIAPRLPQSLRTVLITGTVSFDRVSAHEPWTTSSPTRNYLESEGYESITTLVA